MEFTSVLESVLEVELHSNPWTDLPLRWGKLWLPQKHVVEGSAATGNTLSDALRFLYAMRAFYDTAEEVWTECGVFHYTGKLGFDDFLDELKARCNRSTATDWNDIMEYVKHLYFNVS